MKTEVMPELENVWVLSIKRLTNSRNGNPRFDVTFTDGDSGSWMYRTMTDSAVSYDVENLARSKDLVSVWTTKAGRIYKIAKIAQGDNAHIHQPTDEPGGEPYETGFGKCRTCGQPIIRVGNTTWFLGTHNANRRMCPACGVMPSAEGDRYCEDCSSARDRNSWLG